MNGAAGFFVKVATGPSGGQRSGANDSSSAGKSADVNAHSQTESLLLHHSELKEDGTFAQEDEIIGIDDEPDHDGLCQREQELFLKSIREDTDLTEHWRSAVDSLRIVLAADQSFREGRTVRL